MEREKWRLIKKEILSLRGVYLQVKGSKTTRMKVGGLVVRAVPKEEIKNTGEGTGFKEEKEDTCVFG